MLLSLLEPNVTRLSLLLESGGRVSSVRARRLYRLTRVWRTSKRFNTASKMDRIDDDCRSDEWASRRTPPSLLSEVAASSSSQRFGSADKIAVDVLGILGKGCDRHIESLDVSAYLDRFRRHAIVLGIAVAWETSGTPRIPYK